MRLYLPILIQEIHYQLRLSTIRQQGLIDMIFTKSITINYSTYVHQLHLESVRPLYLAYSGSFLTLNLVTRQISNCHYYRVNLSKDQNHKMIQILYYRLKFIKGYTILYKETSFRQKCIFQIQSIYQFLSNIFTRYHL